ncbi:hypothetical protein [Streptomyces lydicamycinicus]
MTPSKGRLADAGRPLARPHQVRFQVSVVAKTLPALARAAGER